MKITIFVVFAHVTIPFILHVTSIIDGLNCTKLTTFLPHISLFFYVSFWVVPKLPLCVLCSCMGQLSKGKILVNGVSYNQKSFQFSLWESRKKKFFKHHTLLRKLDRISKWAWRHIKFQMKTENVCCCVGKNIRFYCFWWTCALTAVVKLDLQFQAWEDCAAKQNFAMFAKETRTAFQLKTDS